MKAILVIDTDAEHIEDLHISMIWNDVYPVDLGKDVYFKPMPKKQPKDNSNEVNLGFELGWNACLEEITGEKE